MLNSKSLSVIDRAKYQQGQELVRPLLGRAGDLKCFWIYKYWTSIAKCEFRSTELTYWLTFQKRQLWKVCNVVVNPRLSFSKFCPGMNFGRSWYRGTGWSSSLYGVVRLVGRRGDQGRARWQAVPNKTAKSSVCHGEMEENDTTQDGQVPKSYLELASYRNIRDPPFSWSLILV